MTHTYIGDHLDLPEAERSDAELITAVRSGDDSAYATLWSRHEYAAQRLARQLGNPSNAEDLVSEAFLRVLRALKSGSGPDGAFRPYLFSTLRRINIDTGRSYYTRIALTDDDRELEGDHSDSAADVLFDNAEGSAAWRAWNSLPDSTRTLLWHLIIEEETPAQIAPLVGTTPNGVSSRAVRAKERLRQAFLQQHLLAAESEGCRRARGRMGEYVRDALSARDRAEVQGHLDTCDGCRAALFEVSDLNQTMRVLIAPAVLGGAALAGHYLAGVGAGAGKGAISGKAALSGKVVLHHLRNPAVAATAAAVAVALGIGTAFALVSLDGRQHKQAKAVAVTAPSAAAAGRGSAPALAPLPSPTSVTPSPSPSSSPTRASAPGSTPAPSTTAPKVIVVAPHTASPTPIAPRLQTTTVELFVVPADSGVSTATLRLLAKDGWTITEVAVTIGGTAPATNPCTWSGANATCTVSDPQPNIEQHYTVTVVSPSSANPPGELTNSYDDGQRTTTGCNDLGATSTECEQ